MLEKRIIKIFLASPSDVEEGREAVKTVINEINNSGIAKNVTLELTSSDNLNPGHDNADGGAQGVINDQIGNMKEYNLFVAIMWKSIGTPTKNATSGTVEEYKLAFKSLRDKGQPDIWFYFRELIEADGSEDKELKEFKTKIQKRAFFKNYSNFADLKTQFGDNMIQWLTNAKNNTLFHLFLSSLDDEVQKTIYKIVEEISNKSFPYLKENLIFPNPEEITSQKKESFINFLKKIQENLKTKFGNDENIKNGLIDCLINHKGQLLSDNNQPNYAAGNILNLLLQLDLEKDFSYFDLSDIYIGEADLREAILTGVDFSKSQLVNCSFSKSLGCIHSIAFNVDGSLFATGDAHGSIRVHNTESLEKTYILDKKRGSQIWSVAFGSSEKYPQMLGWGSEDGSVEVFNLGSDNLGSDKNDINQKNLSYSIHKYNYGKRISSVAFSPNGNFFAIGGDDGITVISLEHNSRDGVSKKNVNVSCMTFIEDKIIAYGTQDNRQNVKIWDHLGNKPETHLTISQKVRCIAFNKNKKILVSGDEDGKVHMWDTSDSNYKELNNLNNDELNASQVRTLAFSQDGENLAIGCIGNKSSEEQSEHKIWIYEFSGTQWQRKHELGKSNHRGNESEGHKYLIRSIAFCPNPKEPKLLISGGDGRTVKLWNIEENRYNHTLKGYANRIWSVAFSNDGKYFACGSEDNKIRLWNYADRTNIPIQILSEHTDWVWSVAFSPKRNILASASEDNKIFLWKLQGDRWKYISELKGKHNKRVRCVAFSPDGNTLASAGNDNKVVLWDITDVKEPKFSREYTQHTDRVLSLAFSSDGQYLASSSRDRTIYLINIKNLDAEPTQMGDARNLHQDQVHSIAFHPKKNQLISGSFDNKLKLWEVPSGNLIKSWDEEQKILSVAFHPTNEIVASAGDKHIITLWNIEDAPQNDQPHIFKKLKGHKGTVESIAFNNDGTKLISCSQDQTIKFWEINGKINLSIHTVELGKLYQGMNIFGVNGKDSKTESKLLSELEELGASMNS
jgi:WD40 repeat protein